MEYQGLKIDVPRGWQDETIVSIAAPPAATSAMLLGQDQASPANCQIERLHRATIKPEEALRVRLEDLAEALGAVREVSRTRRNGWLSCEIEVDAEDVFRQGIYVRRFGRDLVIVSASARASTFERFRASFEATVDSIALKAA